MGVKKMKAMFEATVQHAIGIFVKLVGTRSHRQRHQHLQQHLQQRLQRLQQQHQWLLLLHI